MTVHRLVRCGSQACRSAIIRPQTRLYRSDSRLPYGSPPCSSEETALLQAAMQHVPVLGFSHTALTAGARDVGLLEVSPAILPKGVFDLVRFHLQSQRSALAQGAQDLPTPATAVTQNLRRLLLRRLHANAPIIKRWPEALAIMGRPSNMEPSLRELRLLVDEFWHLAGDTHVDVSWYTRRGALAAVYTTSELFMTTDQSADFVETDHFVDRRLDEMNATADTFDAVGQWLAYTGRSSLNVLRSKGFWI